ncbi:uncharacterized protein CG3556-like [Periplaneta americana]|uniref:uncharacterized protein CG3556-like n=1 Tax=Periplaneta americana TaxID=6978 RepID=UPI0037E91BE3
MKQILADKMAKFTSYNTILNIICLIILAISVTVHGQHHQDTCPGFNSNHTVGRDYVVVSYTVWVGTDVTSEYSILVIIHQNSSLYRVMEFASVLDPLQYQFTANCTAYGHYITSIGGYAENLAAHESWLIYKTPTPPFVFNPPSKEELTPTGVDTTYVDNGEHYLFWLRNTDFLIPTTTDGQ